MAFFFRTTAFPPLNQITQVPQVVVIDRTGPVVSFGVRPGAICLVGEFVAGPFVPTEVGSQQDITGLYTADGTAYPYFSQDATGIQNGGQVSYNGNALLQLLGKPFQRLILQRVDTEAVMTDGGTTKAVLSITVTVATSDQDGSSNTAKDIIIPAGRRFGDNAVFGTATRVFAVSGNYTIPKGTALTSNQVTVTVPCFPVKVVEPVVSTPIAAINAVIDATLPNVASTTTITGVNNTTALWPSGTGTTLALRIESQYAPAIAKTLPSAPPSSDITVIWAARRTSVIRVALVNNARDSADGGRGRMACVAADPATGTSSAAAISAKSAAIALAGSDNYAQPSPADQAIICFPHSKILVPEFGNIKVTIASDGWMAVTLANLPEEYNPGVANQFIQQIVELEDCFVVNPLSKTDHINLIAGAVAALYHDNQVGWQFMQGVTAASPTAFPTRVPIKRRRMAFFIQDSLNQLAAPYLKQPATTDRRDAFLAEMTTFLEGLKAPGSPAQQRIVDYKIDPQGGNTAPQQALGIFVWKVFVQLLASMDYIVLDTAIGETVTVPATVASAA